MQSEVVSEAEVESEAESSEEESFESKKTKKAKMSVMESDDEVDDLPLSRKTNTIESDEETPSASNNKPKSNAIIFSDDE